MAKIRLSRDLYARATICAAAVSEPVGRWMGLAQNFENLARAEDYIERNRAIVPAALLGTSRNDSLSVTVPGRYVPDPALFRANVAKCVVWCTALLRRPFKTDKRVGVDYLVDADW